MADLVVEREVGDVDLAGAAEAYDRRPEDRAVARHHRQRAHVRRRVVLNTVSKQ